MAKEAPSRRRRSSHSPETSEVPRRRLAWRPALWAAVYVAATTFSFAPTPSFRRAPLTAGAVAPRDIVAPRDVIVPDAAATARRRGEAASEVPPVYDWDVSAPARLEAELRQSFRKARAAAAVSPRPVPLPAPVRDAFELPIGEEALTALARLSFSPAVEDSLVGAASALYHAGVVDNRELLLETRPGGIVARETVSGRETRRREFRDVVEYGTPLKNALAERLAGDKLSGRALSEVAAFLASAIRPNLTYNATETVRRRDEASRGIETVLTRIPRGKVVVRKGDEISPRAAEIIAAVRASASELSAWVRVAGVLLLQSLAALVFWVDSRRQRRRRRERRAEVVFASVMASGIVFALVTRGAFALAQTLSSSFEGSTWATHTYYAIPFAAGAIMVSLVAGMGPALLFAAVQSVGAGVLMGQSFPFALFSIVGSLAGIFAMGKLRSRSVLLAMGGIVAAGNVVSICIISFLNGEARGWDFAGDVLGALAGGWFVAVIVGAFLPVFEHLFHVTTDIRLLELSNQNLPLLRNLALEAPGTYQHSLMLGHLAEAAAEAIGADAVLARVSGYYHDIGKTRMPDYFIENQPKGSNRHDRLEPSMSALVIAAHVKEGFEMGRKARLPEPILDAIREHHGTKLIRYFYQKALTKAEPSQGPVRETDYRHSGPKPTSRVTAILMISDAVEAASRTLIEPTPPKIRAMIQAIVDDCLRDGQFDDCDLTMRDLSLIVDALEKAVAMVFHHRIDYPGFEFNRERIRRRTGEASSPEAAGRGAGPR